MPQHFSLAVLAILLANKHFVSTADVNLVVMAVVRFRVSLTDPVDNGGRAICSAVILTAALRSMRSVCMGTNKASLVGVWT